MGHSRFARGVAFIQLYGLSDRAFSTGRRLRAMAWVKSHKHGKEYSEGASVNF